MSGKGLDDVQSSVDSSLKYILAKLEKKQEQTRNKIDSEQSHQYHIRSQINEFRQKKTAVNAVNKKLTVKLNNTKCDLTDHLHDLQTAQKDRLNTESHIMALKKMLEGVEQ